MKVATSIAAAASLLIASCAPSTPELVYPASQRSFVELNKVCRTNYAAGLNEIQKSLAFNTCNEERKRFADSQGISGWAGIITDISSDQGADVVSVTIQTSLDNFDVSFGTVSNRVSDFGSNSLITPDHPLFSVLTQLTEGEAVTFDAAFLNHPDAARGTWEGSITEQGSMDEPEFYVRMLDIRPYQPSASQVEESEATASADTESVPAELSGDVSSTLENMEYGLARQVLIDRGFRPVVNPDAEFAIPDHYMAQGYTEVDGCRGNCMMLFVAPDGVCTGVLVGDTSDGDDRVLEVRPDATTCSIPHSGETSAATESADDPLSLSDRSYGNAKVELRAAGFVPELHTSDAYPHEVDGDPAVCGNAGCSVPWNHPGNRESICISLSVNDYVDPSLWEAGIRQGSCD